MPEPPFPVRALYEFKAEQDDDLPFSPGQRMTVDEVLDDDWYHGHYVDSATEKRIEGIFPINYVEVEVAPTRPQRRATRPLVSKTNEESGDVPPTTASGKSPKETQSAPQPSGDKPQDQLAAGTSEKQAGGVSEKKELAQPSSKGAEHSISDSVSDSRPQQQGSMPPPPILGRNVDDDDDSWGDGEDDEDEKEIVLGAPKSTLPPEVTAEAAAVRAHDEHAASSKERTGSGSEVAKSGPAERTESGSGANLMKTPVSSVPSDLPTPASEASKVSQSEPMNSAAYENALELESRRQVEESEEKKSQTIQEMAYEKIDDAPKVSRPFREAPLEREEPSESELDNQEIVEETSEKTDINRSPAEKEPDFKTRLARFNQGNAEEDTHEAKKPERHPTFGRKLTFNPAEEEEPHAPHRQSTEEFKPSVSLKERIAMLQKSQEDERANAEADRAAEERRKARRAQLAAEAEANRKAREEAEAAEREEEERIAREKAEKRRAEAEAAAAAAPEQDEQTAPVPPPAPHGLSQDDSEQPPVSKVRGMSLDDSQDDSSVRSPTIPVAHPQESVPHSQESESHAEGGESSSSRAADEEEYDDDAEARRIALRERMARLANSTGGMNLGMIMGVGGIGGSGGGLPKRERRISRSEYEAMSPAEIEAAEARREAEESAPVNIFGERPLPREVVPHNETEEADDDKNEDNTQADVEHAHAAASQDSDHAAAASHNAGDDLPMSPKSVKSTDIHRDNNFQSPGSELSFHDAPNTPSNRDRAPRLDEFDFEDAPKLPDVGSQSLSSAAMGSQSAIKPEDTSSENRAHAGAGSGLDSLNFGASLDPKVRSVVSPPPPPPPGASALDRMASSASSEIGEAPSFLNKATEVPSTESLEGDQKSPGGYEKPTGPVVPDLPARETSAAGHDHHGQQPASRHPPPPPPPPHHPAPISTAAPASPPSQSSPRFPGPPPPPPAVPVHQPPPPAGGPRTAPPVVPPPPPAHHHGHETPPQIPPPSAPPVPTQTTRSPVMPAYAPPPPAPVARPPPPAHPEPTGVPHHHPPPPPPPAQPAPVPGAGYHEPQSQRYSMSPPSHPPPPAHPAPISRASTFGGPPPPPPVAKPVSDDAPSQYHHGQHHGQPLSRSQTREEAASLRRSFSNERPTWLESSRGIPEGLVNKGEAYNVTNSGNERTVLIVHPDWSQTLHVFSLNTGDKISEERRNPPSMDPEGLKAVALRLGPQVLNRANQEAQQAEPTSHWVTHVLESAGALVSGKSYGIEIYANLGNASIQQFDEIRPGDVCVCADATFQGTKGPLQKYHKVYNRAVFIVTEWDGTKRRLHLANNKKEPIRLGDLRMGVIRIFRPVDAKHLTQFS